MGGRGSGRGGSRGGGGGGGASQTHYQLDGALGPRVEDYARTHDVTDLDAVVEWLRCVPAQFAPSMQWQASALLTPRGTPQQHVPRVPAQAGAGAAEGARPQRACHEAAAALSLSLCALTPAAPQSVERIVAALQRRGAGARGDGEARLGALEARHLAQSRAGDDEEDSMETDSDEDSDDEESSGPPDRRERGSYARGCARRRFDAESFPFCSDDGGDLAGGRAFGGLGASCSDSEDEGGPAEQAARERARQALNEQLRGAYARPPRPAGDAPPAHAHQQEEEEERPAFAAPELVAAACARALAAEKAAAAASAAALPAPAAPPRPRPGAGVGGAPAAHAVAPSRKRAAGEGDGDAGEGAPEAATAPKPPPPKRIRPAPRPQAPPPAPSGADNLTLPSAPRGVRLCDLGGIDSCLASIRELILCPLTHPELYAWLGVEPPRGVLLAGPPGCGKTSLAHAIAAEAGVPFFAIAAPEIVSGMSGESEAKLRGLFSAAAAAAPCIVFIDEIDAIAPKRESAQREMERRIVAQLLACLDDLSSGSAGGKGGAHVVILGATNRPDALDTALRRAGRFDREITLGVPDEPARSRILAAQASKVRLEGDFDFDRIARLTPGYVGADLMALTKEAAALAVSRIFTALLPASAEAAAPQALLLAGHEPLTDAQLASLAITMGDYEAALPRVQPSAQREGFATVPDVSWADVGSLDEVREELAFAITLPIAHPARFKALNLGGSMGVLLYGPPGCGKTLVARATAADARANFISIKGPELLNKYVGESERAVRTVFARAAAAAPCVLFFDELDSLAPRRGGDSGSPAAERVVNQMLTEMDGLDPRKGVFVVAATNRPDMIDPAMLRPGRLDKLLFVPLPPAEGRASILAALTRRTPLSSDVDVAAIGRRCEGFSGADLSSLVREASWAALRATYADEGVSRGCEASHAPEAPVREALCVSQQHFEDALLRVSPSVSEEDRRRYERLRNRLQGTRGLPALPHPDGAS